MVGLVARVRTRVAAVRRKVEEALREQHTPEQVASSFAIGVFITALPTLGVGVLAFFVIAYLFENVSKIALFASVIVLNPVVKWGVYGTSFWLGSSILGPVEGISLSQVSIDAAPGIVSRLLVGNLLIAVLFTVVAYFGAYRLTVEYRRRRGDVGILEEAYEGLFDRTDGR